MDDWSEWQSFPDPRKGDYLHAPFGPGVYEIRQRSTGLLVTVGKGNNVAYRMTSILPSPLGQGTRRNDDKRNFALNHLSDIEYRTMACNCEAQALRVEKALRQSYAYIFQA